MEKNLLTKVVEHCMQNGVVIQKLRSLLGTRFYSSFNNRDFDDDDDFEMDFPSKGRGSYGSDETHGKGSYNQQYSYEGSSGQHDFNRGRHGERDFNRGYGQHDNNRGYGQRDYNRGGYGPRNYNRGGYGQRDYNRGGYGQRDLNRGGYAQHEFNKGGYDQQNSFGRRRSNIILNKVNWEQYNLEPIKKKLYVESESVKNYTIEEIMDFRNKNDIVINGKDQDLKPILKFSDYEFPQPLKNALDKMQFEAPLPIQSQTWPLVLSGLDVIGIGQTGSGKTLAFVLPAIIHICAQSEQPSPNVVILCPTRELAQQISAVIQSICNFIPSINLVCLYGGASKANQILELRRKQPNIIVATPGRLMDMISDNFCIINKCSYFVLDEADRMLDMGFEPQIRSISDQIRRDRQVLMWSATWPNDVRSLAREFLGEETVQINIGTSELTANPDITQEFLFCNDFEKSDRINLIIKEEKEKGKKVLIFTETKQQVTQLYWMLQNFKHRVNELHGGLSQSRRDYSIRNFKNGVVDIIVATDVASRGLDVSDIGVVVNYQMPRDVESYVHRIGRTARAGKEGRAVSFFSYNDVGIASQLITILRKAGQKVPDELMAYAKPNRHRRF